MNPVAIFLVVLSAVVHSFWNLLAKKSKNKLVYNWYIVVFGAILYFPFFIYFIGTIAIPTIGWKFIILSAVFHVFYYYFLGKSYEHGQLSLTYPLARSSSLFVPILALILIKEKLSPIGILGIITILIGIYILHLRSLSPKSLLEPLKYIKEKATIFALLTALFSAFYSVNDKMGVILVFPFLYIYLTWVLISIFYLPIIAINRNHLKKEWTHNWKSIILSGFLVILSYVLTLFALRIDKVSYVVSLRQLSIVFGVILGVSLLGEKCGIIRIAASMIMLIGFVLVSIA